MGITDGSQQPAIPIAGIGGGGGGGAYMTGAGGGAQGLKHDGPGWQQSNCWSVG